MSIGVDLKEVLQEVGTAFTVIRESGNIEGEYLDFELNSQVTKPFIQEFFLEAVLQYDTSVNVGDIIEFSVNGVRYMLMNKTPEMFENAIISYASVLYKCNVKIDVRRPSEGDWDRSHSYDRYTSWEIIKSNIDALLTTPLYGNSLETDEELGLIGIQKGELYLPSSVGIKVLDRIRLEKDEYYRVEAVKKRRYSAVDVIDVGEDTRPSFSTTSSTTTTSSSSTTTTTA